MTDKIANILTKAENIADVILKHLGEKGGCNHKISIIVEEAFGPSFDGQDQYQSCSNQTKEITT